MDKTRTLKVLFFKPKHSQLIIDFKIVIITFKFDLLSFTYKQDFFPQPIFIE
jgi:hypothetical protein